MAAQYVRPEDGEWRHDRSAVSTTAFDIGREDCMYGRFCDPGKFMQAWEQLAYERGFSMEHDDLDYVLLYYTRPNKGR